MTADKDPRFPLPEENRPSDIEERITRKVLHAMDQHDVKIRDHIRSEFKTLEDVIRSAFPDGDVHGHRAAHERQIKRANRWEDIKAEFITKAFTAGSMAAMGFMLMLVWEYLKSGGKT